MLICAPLEIFGGSISYVFKKKMKVWILFWGGTNFKVAIQFSFPRPHSNYNIFHLDIF
jgi:hypothetical protein